MEKQFVDFLQKLSLDDLKNMCFDYRNIFKTATLYNPLTIEMGNRINEGLIHTYPIDKTISYIKSYFNLQDEQIIKQEAYNGAYHILVFIPFFKENVDAIRKAMSVCGYFLSYTEILKHFPIDFIKLQFEAKIQENVSDKIREEESVLYHLTPSYNVRKILSIGFSPRCKNAVFDYPGRVYFIRGTVNIDDIFILGFQLNKYNNSLGNNGEYELFEIDLSKIPENIPLYIDNNYPYGVYTNSNIRPNVILRHGRIQF